MHEGEQTNLDELAGKVIVITGYDIVNSTLADAKEGDTFASVDAILVSKKEKIWFNTSSTYVKGKLDEIKEFLPIQCRVEKGLSKNKKKYFNLVPVIAEDEGTLIKWFNKKPDDGGVAA